MSQLLSAVPVPVEAIPDFRVATVDMRREYSESTTGCSKDIAFANTNVEAKGMPMARGLVRKDLSESEVTRDSCPLVHDL